MRINLPTGTVAELARPDVEPAMGLVVAADVFGLRPLYDEMCLRFARELNAIVVAPEPFPGPDLGPAIEARVAAMPTKADDASLADLVAAADATGQARVALIGFCMGGMYCFKAGALGRFERIVAFYGMIRLPDAWRSAVQGEPLDALRGADTSRLLAVVGGRDHYTPPADVDALEATGVQVVRYPEAEHAFAHDPSRPMHRADDAADAFARAFAFLRS
jgi:carboxymethylenebutenolidase